MIARRAEAGRRRAGPVQPVHLVFGQSKARRHDVAFELRHRARRFLYDSKDLNARKLFDGVYDTFSPRLANELRFHLVQKTRKSLPVCDGL